MTGSYAHFFHNYADSDTPLSDLFKESTWHWTEWEQLAFKGLKTALSIAPVLVYLDFTQPFSYAMDGSDIAVSAVL